MLGAVKGIRAIRTQCIAPTILPSNRERTLDNTRCTSLYGIIKK